MTALLSRVTHVHFTWFTTLCLDVILLVLLCWWYMGATFDAPLVPHPQTGQTFLAPVADQTYVRTPSTRCIGCRVTFHSAYVGPFTFGMLCFLVANSIVLMLGAVGSFFRQLM